MRATAMVLFLYDPCGASPWARLFWTPGRCALRYPDCTNSKSHNCCIGEVGTPDAYVAGDDTPPRIPGRQGNQRFLERGKPGAVKDPRADVSDFVVLPIVAAVILGYHHMLERGP